MSEQSPVRTPRRRRSSRGAALLAAATAVAATATAVTVTLTPAATAASATASPAAGVRHPVTVLRFTVRFSPFHPVDVPPLAKHAGDYGPGDYVVFSDDLVDGKGHVVGTEGGSGLVTKASATEIQVAYDFTIGLRQGQIAVQGLASPAPTKRLGIVGGTGRYVGASGHIDLVENGDGTGTLVVTLGA